MVYKIPDRVKRMGPVGRARYFKKQDKQLLGAGSLLAGGMIAAPALVGAGIGKLKHKIADHPGQEDTATGKGLRIGALAGAVPAVPLAALLALGPGKRLLGNKYLQKAMKRRR